MDANNDSGLWKFVAPVVLGAPIVAGLAGIVNGIAAANNITEKQSYIEYIGHVIGYAGKYMVCGSVVGAGILGAAILVYCINYPSGSSPAE